jgi:hypothetical protein
MWSLSLNVLSMIGRMALLVLQLGLQKWTKDLILTVQVDDKAA